MKEISVIGSFQVEIQVQRSAYTHRSHNTAKSKGSSIGPTGALLIAPDGEVLNVGGPAGHTESGELIDRDKGFMRLFI